MKNKAFWSILLFAGMIIAAGVCFNSCEQKSNASGGGGSSSGGGGSTVSDTLEHCWEVNFKYEGSDEIFTEYLWATQKEMENEMKDPAYIQYSYKLTTATSRSACAAKNYDPDEKQCWEITYTYKGDSQSYTWYEWATLKEIQESEQNAAARGDKITYEAGYAGDEESCEKRNGQGGGGEEPQVQAYYIKHPWGTGQDADWSWKEFEYEEIEGQIVYYIYDYWGGVGANINTAPDDAGATWIPAEHIYGSGNVMIGQSVVFEFNPENTTLMVGVAN